MRAEDAVWNRACEWELEPCTRPGDLALRDMIFFHGLAMNGGPLHAWGTVGKDGTTAARAGYQFFGLDAAADVVAWLLDTVAEADLSDPEAAEAVELAANERYYAAVPDDDHLVAGFERTYGRTPEAFDPPA